MAASSSKKRATAGAASTPNDTKRRRTVTTTAAPGDADDALLPPCSHGAEPPPTLLAKADRIRLQLAKLYPPPVPIPLDHASPFQLLVAVVLSAQTTDLKVNEATPSLFAAAPTPAKMAALGADGILPHVRSLGLAPTKSRNLAALSALLIERHGGEVPATLDALIALPGVGRKTASVVLSQAHGGRSFPVDTHIHRLAQRWGLTPPGPSVEQTERDLRAVFPDAGHWRDLHLQIILFGRAYCPAKTHDPSACPICSWAAVPPFDAAVGGGAGAAGTTTSDKRRAASVSPVKAGGGAASALLVRKMAADRAGGGGGGDGDDEEERSEKPRRPPRARKQ